jgi:uncharacterized protein (UPF0276 family)
MGAISVISNNYKVDGSTSYSLAEMVLSQQLTNFPLAFFGVTYNLGKVKKQDTQNNNIIKNFYKSIIYSYILR